MNKEFKRLVDEAGFIRFSPEEDPHTPIDWSCDYSEELEKFAELIVQKCAYLVDTLNEAYDAPSTSGKFIKDHFEVE